MFRLLLLIVGGALGTLARYGLNSLISEHQSKHYPWAVVFPLGTLVVNITGCFAIGVIAAVSGPATGRVWLKSEWRDFFDDRALRRLHHVFQLRTADTQPGTRWRVAAVTVSIVGSNVLGLLAVYLGLVCGRALQAKLHGGAL
jgi:fluoride ion exporter CrcB/FEX